MCLVLVCVLCVLCCVCVVSGDRRRACEVTSNHKVGVQLVYRKAKFYVEHYFGLLVNGQCSKKITSRFLLACFYEHETSEYGNVPSTRFPATEELAFAPGFQMMVYRMSGDFSTKQQKKNVGALHGCFASFGLRCHLLLACPCQPGLGVT